MESPQLIAQNKRNHKSATKQEQSQACLSFAEREQIRRSQIIHHKSKNHANHYQPKRTKKIRYSGFSLNRWSIHLRYGRKRPNRPTDRQVPHSPSFLQTAKTPDATTRFRICKLFPLPPTGRSQPQYGHAQVLSHVEARERSVWP